MNITIELQIKVTYNIVHLLIFTMKTWHNLTFHAIYIGCDKEKDILLVIVHSRLL